MQKVLIVYEINAGKSMFFANSVAEVENYPLSAGELWDYENQLKVAGNYDGVLITNIIPLREDK